METWPWLYIVIVMVSDEDARGIHRKCPKAIEVHLFTHLQGSRDQHQATAEPLRSDTLHSPKALHIQQILWMEEEYASLGVKVI